MQIQEILFSQGFGTRRVCAGLVQQGWVSVVQTESGATIQCHDALEHFEPEGLVFEVQGQRWAYQKNAYILLHKPAGVECSQKPSLYPSVYSLLPSPLRHRPQKSAVQGVQAVGRLDQDTTGMLLLSDDGQFIHRLSSPKKHIPKVYQATVKHPLTDVQITRLCEGVVLDDDPHPVKATRASAIDEHVLELVLTEGKYHQVKRMVAAVGNRVERLHRSQMGSLCLPSHLLPGQWCWLSKDDLAALYLQPPVCV